MSSYDEAFDALMNIEKGYSNNPADPGGETMWGITERVARAHGYTGSMRMLPRVTAKDIAKKAYWDVARCDELPPAIAFDVFDTIYNGGRAVKWLQLAVGASPDGVIGPATIAAANTANPDRTRLIFNSYRLGYYADLDGFTTFGRGWTRRIASNLMKGGQ